MKYLRFYWGNTLPYSTRR